MSEELITDTVQSRHNDEYFDGNDVKSHHAQSGESYSDMRDREDAAPVVEVDTDTQLSPAEERFQQVYQDTLRRSGNNEALARKAEQEARENYQIGVEFAMAAQGEQQQAQEQVQMQE